jgi:hypothetical protein
MHTNQTPGPRHWTPPVVATQARRGGAGTRRIAGRLFLVLFLAAPAAGAAASEPTRLAAAAECPAFAWSPPAEGAIAVVGPAELDGALARARAGGTILLAGGDYGRHEIAGYNPSGTVTIGAADPDDPPVLNGLVIEHSSGLVLAGLAFRIDGSKPFSVSKPDAGLRIRDSSRISVQGAFFTGYVEAPGAVYVVRDVTRGTKAPIDFSGLGRGMGMNVNHSDHIEVLGSTFADLTVGTNFNNSSNLRFAGNSFTGISVDSTDWGGITGLMFEGNLIADNRVPRGMKHADLMQFRFSTSRDVTIRDNLLISAVPASHGIYFGNGPKERDHRYEDIAVTDNQLYVSGRLALSVSGSDGVTITGNSVLANRDAGGGPAAILVGESSTGVTVTGNVANFVGAWGQNWSDRPKPPDWGMTDNRILRGPVPPPAIGQAPGCDSR